MDFNILNVRSTVPKRSDVINLDKSFLICPFQKQVCKHIRGFWVTNSILDSSRTQSICAEENTDKTSTKLEAFPRKLLVQNATT